MQYARIKRCKHERSKAIYLMSLQPVVQQIRAPQEFFEA